MGYPRKFRHAVAGAVLATALSGPVSACDIALALAVDVSGSVDLQEYVLQMEGLAAAIADSTVADALVRAKARVLLVQWTGRDRQEASLPWRQITSHQDALDLARDIRTAPRPWRNFSTAIGEALVFTKAQFADVTDCRRKVIDVSGDGASNEGLAPGDLRRVLWQDGFVVNGLAIEGSEPDLTAYYWENVMAGDGAFVMTANGFADFPKRIKLKLLREVTQQVSALPLSSSPAKNQ
jgi:Ca-activated chloride channel family protein